MPIEFVGGTKEANPTPKSAPAPKTSPETGNRELSDVGKQAEQHLPTREGQNLFLKNLGAELEKNLSKLSPETQKRLLNPDGSVNQNKLASLYGLSHSFQRHLSPEGKIRPLEEVPTDEKDSKPETATDSTSKNPKIPERPKEAMTGKDFLAEMQGLGEMTASRGGRKNQETMERRIMEELDKGNTASYMRPENWVTREQVAADGTKIRYKIPPDYICIGSDTDCARVPMTPLLARQLCDKYNWGFPTGPMTDAIHDSADIKLTGVGLVNTKSDANQMEGIGFISRHNKTINDQLGEEGLRRLREGKTVIAGHKKDLIISQTVVDNPNGPLDFRGLYTDGRNPIQTNPAHEWSYRDYSHAFRPVDGNVTVDKPDGRSATYRYYDVLKGYRDVTDPDSGEKRREDLSQLAKALNGAQGAFNADLAYRSSQKNTSDQSRIAGNSRSRKKPSAT